MAGSGSMGGKFVLVIVLNPVNPILTRWISAAVAGVRCSTTAMGAPSYHIARIVIRNHGCYHPISSMRVGGFIYVGKRYQ
jgi:hypothetical protein